MEIANKIFFGQIETLLAEGQDVQLRIKGYSMRPFLRSDKDIVVLKPYRSDKLKVHDVILFRCAERHILHRIIRHDHDTLTMQGDGNYKTQEQCTLDDVIGIATRIIRPSGRTIKCSSRWWLFCSNCWLILPQIVKRYILAVMRKLKIA